MKTAAFGELYASKLSITHTFFNNLHALFESYHFPLNKIFNLDESDISAVINNMLKMTEGKGKAGGKDCIRR